MRPTIQDQGTVRIDHDFSNNDTAMARYSLSSENGFSPTNGSTSTTENLPGFGANFDNLSQQAVISWNHVFSSNKLNTASLALSRLSMDHTSQNNGVNDIVGQLGIQGIGFGGPGAWGAPSVRRARLHRNRRHLRRHPHARLGHDHRTARHVCLAARPSRVPLRRRRAAATSGRCGDSFQNRGFYQFTNGYTTQFGFNDGSGSGFASLLLSLPTVKQRQAGVPQMDLRNWGYDGFAEDSWQITPTTTLNLGLRYEYTSPLYDLRETNTQPGLQQRRALGLHRWRKRLSDRT